MLAIIGGSGLNELDLGEFKQKKNLISSYGEASSALTIREINGVEVGFLARHGQPHSLAPHLINYRANIDALHKAGITRVIAINAVGGISEKCHTGAFVVPDQIIDYSYGREHTFGDGVSEPLHHIDFSLPYDEALREQLVEAFQASNVTCIDRACHGVTQGPRLETAAEIIRMRRDGCDIVGMTGMPEAALAKELGLAYVSLSLVVNPAAGLSDQIITIEDIQAVMQEGMDRIMAVIEQFCRTA